MCHPERGVAVDGHQLTRSYLPQIETNGRLIIVSHLMITYLTETQDLRRLRNAVYVRYVSILVSILFVVMSGSLRVFRQTQERSH